MKLIVFASNLHYGGGVQVATSTILDLSKNEEIAKNIHVYVSSKINSNLIETDFKSRNFYKYEILDSFGIFSIFQNNKILNNEYNVFFVIFGPFYSIKKPKNLIQGFANPWIINPQNDIFKSYNYIKKIVIKIKLEIQKYFFRRSSVLFVEDQSIKEDLIKLLHFDVERIKVIPNNISEIYFNSHLWQKIKFNFNPFINRIKIGYIGRNYPHKNTKILPYVKTILNNKYAMECEFFVTFSDKEWNNSSDFFKNNINNLGELTLSECPDFYLNMDAIIFPTLLECFSVTPLETFFMEKPLFASDRDFIKNICKDFPIYFNPLNPEEIAKTIYLFFNLKNCISNNIKLQKDFILNYTNSYNRTFEYYKQIINHNSIQT